MASFTKITEDLKFVSALPDKPRLENGFSAAVLKSVFDMAADIIKEYINSTLIPELENTVLTQSGADRIGCTPLGGDDFTAATVRGILSELKGRCDILNAKIDSSIKNIVMGAIADGSISEEKLTNELAEKIKEASGMLLRCTSFSDPGTHSFTVPKTGFYRISVQGAGGGGTLNTDVPSADGRYECTGGPSGAFAQVMCELTKGDIYTVNVGAGGAGAGNSLFSLNTVYPTADYTSIYRSSPTHHNSPGEASSFSKGEDSITAPGGTRGSYNNIPALRGIFAASTAALEAGRITEAFYGNSVYPDHTPEETDAMRGCSSHYGAGGFETSSGDKSDASFGAGGSGGQWLYNSLADTFKFTRKSAKGGDGIVTIEYIY